MNKLIPVIALSAVALAGCSAAPATPDDGLIHVVASTSVYGDLVSTIGGDRVEVTSLISDASVDPHSFEASARDQLAISEADLIVENGGGYDPFVDTLLTAAGSTAPVITAVDVSGLDGAGQEGFNEHVWYSFAATEKVVGAVADQLGQLDPDHADEYTANADALGSAIADLLTRAEGLGVTGDVAVTEPVPGYLLQAAGLTNVTPADFTEAIEEGNDVPPLALQETLALFTGDKVLLLAYNSQTASPETERVRQAAEDAGIPVVDFTETLPAGADYVSWMTSNLDALATALGR